MPLVIAPAAQTYIAAPPAPPAPPIIVAPATASRPNYQVEVKVEGGGAVLWSGVLTVGGGVTSLNHHVSEPGPDCGGFRSSHENSYSLTLYSNADRNGQERVQVNANWARSDAGGCAAPSGSRSVGLTQAADLASGQTVVLRGDGGLTVTLRRR